jgi:repressor LexA
MPLTKRQKEILDYLEDYIERNGYAPRFEEIADHFSYASLGTVHEHLENLQRKGYIRKSYKEWRSIELESAPSDGTEVLELPLLGTVAAGVPIEAIPEQETVSVPSDMIRRGSNYVLRVQGDSMVDEHIQDGDYIIVNSRQTANNGEMVVALVEGDSATVKKFYQEREGRIRLQPANPSMTPLYYNADQVAVQGIVVGVIRRY